MRRFCETLAVCGDAAICDKPAVDFIINMDGKKVWLCAMHYDLFAASPGVVERNGILTDIYWELTQ